MPYGPFTFLRQKDAAPPLKDPTAVANLFAQYRRQVIVGLSLGYGFAYTCRLGFSVVKKPLLDQGIFTADQLGMIGAAFLWGYGLGKLFNGFLADRAHPARFFSFGLGVSAVINLMMGLQSNVIICVVIWALNGWFQGFLAPTAGIIITSWFSRRERGFVYGVWSASHSLGEGLTFVGTAAVVAATMWRAAFIAPAVLCALVATALWFALKGHPRTYGLPDINTHKGLKKRSDNVTGPSTSAAAPTAGPDTEPETPPRATFNDQLKVLKNPAIWVLGASSACMYMTRYAVNSWGILYVQEEYSYSLVDAGLMVALNTVFGILGSPVYGFISDKYFKGRRPPLTLIFGIVEVFSLYLIFFPPGGSHILIGVGFMLYGFTLSGLLAVLGGLFAVDISDKRTAGTAMGVVGVFSYLGAGSQDLISGFLIDKGTSMVDGVKHVDFSAPITFWMGASVCSVVLASTLWNKRSVD